MGSTTHAVCRQDETSWFSKVGNSDMFLLKSERYKGQNWTSRTEYTCKSASRPLNSSVVRSPPYLRAKYERLRIERQWRL